MIWVIGIIAIILILFFITSRKVFIPDEDTEGEKIMQVKVAGSRHYNTEVKPDELVRLSHDPANEHDPNAIEILKLNGKKVGFVPKKHNKKILQIMNNADVFGKIVAVYYKGKEVHVNLLKHVPS